MKNLNENISRVKSIMNLIYEEKNNVEPTDWQVGDVFITHIDVENSDFDTVIVKVISKDYSEIEYDNI